MRGVPADGDAIKRLRKRQGLTQESLAWRAECDPKTIRKAERSLHVDPSTINCLAAALGVEPSELISGPSLDREQANTQLILDWQEAFNRRDPDAIAEFFHEDGTVTVMSDVPIPGGGLFQGKAAVYQWAKVCFETFRTHPIMPDMMQIDAVGDLVFVFPVKGIQVTSVLTGQTAEATAAHEFRIRDGRITSHRVITNTATLAKIIEEAEGEPANVE